MIDALQDIAAEFGEIFGPVITAAEDPGSCVDLLAELGWTVAAVPKPITDLIASGSDLLSAVSQDAPVADLLSAIAKFVRALDAIVEQPDTDFTNDVDVATFKQTIARDLLDYAICEHLLVNRSRIGLILQLAGIIRLTQQPQTGHRLPHLERRFAWEEIGSIVVDPAKGFQEAFSWDAQNAQAPYALAVLASLLESLGLQFLYFRPDDQQGALITGLTGTEAPQNGLDLAFGQSLGLADGSEAGIQVVLGSGGTGQSGAIFLFPYAQGVPGTGQSTTGLSVGDSGTLASGLAFVFKPGDGAELHTGFRDGSTKNGAGFAIQVQTAPPQDGTEVVLIGSADASRFAARAVRVSAGTRSGSGNAPDLYVELVLDNAHIVIRSETGESDGFIANVLGGGVDLDFSLGLTFSSTTGFCLSGQAGLTGTFVINQTLGPLAAGAIVFGLIARDGGVDVEAGVTLTVQIGPVAATMDDVGIRLSARFPTRPTGNLGLADVNVNFKAPSGVGLAIDTTGVSGGGFLTHDDAKQEYSGVLQLQYIDLALQAFGLITTQVAGGTGYSLLALVDANFPPVQLGWGFTLNGVGGLLALNRSASTDALQAALKANTLSTILFPKSAIANASQILSSLDALFPTAAGRFLFGPMALIGWGTPELLTAAIAVIVELPEPIRIVLIARLSAKLPSQSNALIRINVDALGVLDLSQDTLSLDATLFDSKLLQFTLTGNMALRANWGSTSQREFLLAIGGFNPHFTPPAGFPPLQRITIDMPSGPVSKLRLAAYLAITSNTLQFGATLDVFIGVSGYGLSGHLGFDALLQFDPLHFDADISGQVALMAGSDDLMSVGLNATLSGPAPWHIAGDFKMHIVFFDVHISFSHSWGDDAPEQQIAPVAVLPLLTAALADSRNWGAPLPAGTQSFVSLNSNGAQLVHPLAGLEVHESVVPLGLAIDCFGSAPVTGANSFTISDYQVNGSSVDHLSIQDDFAPAQFLNLSDDDKLAAPSFEPHDAGVRLSGTGLTTCGLPIQKTIAYQTFYIDQPGGDLRSDPVTPPQTFVLGELASVLSIGASARASVRTSGNQKYLAPGAPVSVIPQSFVIADRNTLAAAAIPLPGSTYSDVKAALNAQEPALRVTLQIVASHELAAS